MNILLRPLLTSLLAAATLASQGAPAPAPAPAPAREFKPILDKIDLKDGDTLVFLGDSITHQCLYTQYIEDYFYMEWVGFVDQLTRLTKGVAFYCTSGDLANAIMESYLSGRKRRTFIA